MKKLITVVSMLIMSTLLYAQGKIVESLKIQSAILGKEVEYSVYLPENYEAATRRFPVLYLLHGYTDDETGWTQYGEVERIANESIAKGEATPMIIAMPDGGVSWYINDAAGKVKYEDFFIKEFIPYIDSVYKTRNVKAHRAVAGLSMGGYGSLVFGTKHPDLFAACAPLSAAVWNDEHIINMPAKDWSNFKFNELFGSNEAGKKRLTDTWNNNSILRIVASTPAEKLNQVRFYIDCGDDDFLIKGNMELHAAMTDKKINHEFRVRDGAHTWEYWRTSLPEVLKFVTASFHR